MATIALAPFPVAALKRNLATALEDVPSSHLTEAIAAGLGFRTHAALKAALPQSQNDAPPAHFDQPRFISRLSELGHTETLAEYSCSTMTQAYTTSRDKAWRNLVVAAVNEAILRGLLKLQPEGLPAVEPEERWEHQFEFALPNGRAATALIRDGGFDEVIVRVVVNPTGPLFRAQGAGLHAGDALAGAWLERRDGAWVQNNGSPEFACRKALLAELAELEVVPLGFADCA